MKKYIYSDELLAEDFIKLEIPIILNQTRCGANSKLSPAVVSYIPYAYFFSSTPPFSAILHRFINNSRNASYLNNPS